LAEYDAVAGGESQKNSITTTRESANSYPGCFRTALEADVTHEAAMKENKEHGVDDTQQ
jgi:hypothetical protein